MLPLRSLNHNEPAYVQFQNQTNRNIDIVWINYMGAFQKYITLKPRENINIDTYASHPWIFIDRQTGVRMRVGQGNIFYPYSNSEVMRRLGLYEDLDFPVRVPIPILLPLFTLREIALQSVYGLLKDSNDVDNLELPQTLKRDIRRFCQEKEEIISTYE